ncbi:MAG: ion transporter, partial [Deltaproteobacteria bacterium]|nr:ion transporter [Deltaproteobacteria bacterium]
MEPARPHALVRTLHAYLDSRIGRVLVLGIVLLSVVPEIRIDEQYWPVFLLLFGGEAVVRILAARAQSPRNALDTVLNAIDVAAALTFLPLDGIIPALPLDVVRSLRVLLIVRPIQPTLRDLWSLVVRRERMQQFFTVTVAVTLLAFLSAVMLANATQDVPFDYNMDGRTGDDGFLDAVWWTFRQLESADNLLVSVRHHPLIVAASLGLTVTGVFVVAFIIGIGAGVVEQLLKAQRRREVAFSGHSVVVGPVHDAEMLVRQFVRIYAKNRARWRFRDVVRTVLGDTPGAHRHALPFVALLGEHEEPPAYLYEPLMKWVAYRAGDCGAHRSMQLVAAQRAKRAILLTHGDRSPDEADGLTIAALGNLRRDNPGALAYVEVLDGHNVELARRVGGPGTYAVDVPRLLGLFLCQHLVVPRVERLYAELLGVEGQEIYTHVFVEGWERALVRRWAKDQREVSWEVLRDAALARGVELLGVLLGRDDCTVVSSTGAVQTDELVAWMNPLGPPDRHEALPLGARPGFVPISTLRGFVGLAETYTEVRAVAYGLLRGPLPLPGEPLAPSADALKVARALVHDDGDIDRLLIVGLSPALPSMVSELMRFRPSCEVVLLVPGELAEDDLDDRLGSIPLRWTERSGDLDDDGLRVPGEGDACVRIFRARGASLGRFAVELADRLGDLDAAVYLSEARAVDPDSRTSLRVLRLAQRLAQRRGGTETRRISLVVEMRSEDKAEILHKDIAKIGPNLGSRLRLTTLSTEKIKSFFMVHSAFVPAVIEIYEELLNEHGNEFT